MNNVSAGHAAFLKKQRNRRFLIMALRAAIFILIFALWEVLTRVGVLDPFIVSSPVRCVKTVLSLIREGTLFLHIGTTLAETAAGFFIGSILGIVIAALLWYSELASRVLEPYLIILNALPKIALGPVIIVWIGSGMGAVVAVTLLVSLVVTIIGVLNGFTGVDPEKVLLLKTFGASKSQVFFRVILPASIPTTVSTLKINVGMAWVGVIVGEFLSSKNGLGYLIVYGGQVFKLDLVMASILILCVLAALMYWLVSLLEKWVNGMLHD